ncbi:MAG: HSP90 family protein [Cytophagales bacterium]|nr:HSP90 family protein [Cytophagales bacterium]
MERFQVNFKGILKILSQHLYSSPNVFLRELLQNSMDAISARENYDTNFKDGRVNVELIEGENRNTLIFEDNGIGLTKEEVGMFLASIGSSSKSVEVIQKGHQKNFIGQFGIGMLSCFTVSNELVVITKSCKEGKALKWTANVEGTYTTTEIEGDYEYGTKVFIDLYKEFKTKYGFDEICKLLKHYGEYLSIDVFTLHQDKYLEIGGQSFPWQETQGVKTSLLGLGRRAFDIDFELCIPLYSESTKSEGLAYILPFKTKPNAHGNHHIYIKNMMITKEENNIVPDWAFFVKCIVNSESLVPTASRESLYQNEELKQTQQDFGNCIKQYLRELAESNLDSLKWILAVHNEAIKGLALQDDEFFDIVAKWLEMPTSQGNLSLQDIVDQSDIVRYVSDIDQYRQLLPIAKANDQLVVNTGYLYDTQIIERISSKYPLQEFESLTTESFTNILEDLTWDEEQALYDFQKSCNDYLKKFNCKVFIKKFNPHSLPALFYLSNNGEYIRTIARTQKKTDNVWGDVLGDILGSQPQQESSKLYLNINNSLMKKLSTQQNIVLYVELIYVNALLMGHYPMSDEEMQLLNNNLITLIELGIG